MLQNREGGSVDNDNEAVHGIWLQVLAMEVSSLFHSFLSLLGIIYCLIMIFLPALSGAGTDGAPEEEHKRTEPNASKTPSTPKCGATALRLNLDLNRLHGKWYPTEASDSAYFLWMTSLYGRGDTEHVKGPTPDCVVLNFQPGPEAQTLNIELGHVNKSVTVQAALLADAVHPGTSKWVISWPNGEDTLTSIVATGSLNSENRYDWMLTVDCDLNGSVAPDWAIFSREGGLSAPAMDAIKAILSGIEGLRSSGLQNPNNCTRN